MTRPRADAVIRRFLDGASLAQLCVWISEDDKDGAMHYIEQCIRRRLNAAGKGKRK